MLLFTASNTKQDLPESLLISVYILLNNFFTDIFLSVKKPTVLGGSSLYVAGLVSKETEPLSSATSKVHLLLLMELFLKNFLHVGLKVCCGVSKLVSYSFNCYQNFICLTICKLFSFFSQELVACGIQMTFMRQRNGAWS